MPESKLGYLLTNMNQHPWFPQITPWSLKLLMMSVIGNPNSFLCGFRLSWFAVAFKALTHLTIPFRVASNTDWLFQLILHWLISVCFDSYQPVDQDRHPVMMAIGVSTSLRCVTGTAIAVTELTKPTAHRHLNVSTALWPLSLLWRLLCSQLLVMLQISDFLCIVPDKSHVVSLHE